MVGHDSVFRYGGLIATIFGLTSPLGKGILWHCAAIPLADFSDDRPCRPSAPFSRETRISIGFLNFAHAADHFVLLIYPTVVIGLEAVYARTYGELIALSTAAFISFGVFSLPAGWLGDHWSRRNMMALFWFGCGVSLIAAGCAVADHACGRAAALGMFAAIYHPVGMAMLIEASNARGRTLAFNGVCGNLGVALAAGITA